MNNSDKEMASVLEVSFDMKRPTFSNVFFNKIIEKKRWRSSILNQTLKYLKNSELGLYNY